MKWAVAAGAALLLGSGACRDVTDPRRALVSYAISAFACDTNAGCDVPDSIHIGSARRGDTVWIFSGVEGGNPFTGTGALVTLHADCALNVVLLDGTTPLRTFPAPLTCPDSTIDALIFRPPQATVDRFFRWVVDSAIVPKTYVVEGRMLVAPELRPAFVFEVR